MKKRNANWSRLRSLFKSKKISLDNNEEHIFNGEFVSIGENEVQLTYTFKNGISVEIEKPQKELGLESVKKNRDDRIDSTGYLMWPSESLLTALIFEHKFQNLSSAILSSQGENKIQILELGAGYSGLLGIALVKLLKREGFNNFKMVITDGNEECEGKL